MLGLIVGVGWGLIWFFGVAMVEVLVGAGLWEADGERADDDDVVVVAGR